MITIIRYTYCQQVFNKVVKGLDGKMRIFFTIVTEAIKYYAQTLIHNTPQT